MRKQVKEIPTLEQIKAGTIERTDLQKLLDNEPPREWLREHPTAKNEKGDPVLYLPIDKIDQLLTDIYAGAWTEITNTSLTPNSISITLRLFVVNPENGRVEHVDGIGAASSRVGIEAAAPIAESLAKKNAAKKLGRLFGRDLSREFEGMERKTVTAGEPEIKQDLPEQKENPVKERLLKQTAKSRTLTGLTNVLKATRLRLEGGQLTEEEIEEVTEAINARAKKLGFEV